MIYDVFKELIRTRLIYLIIGAILAVALDFFVLKPQQERLVDNLALHEQQIVTDTADLALPEVPAPVVDTTLESEVAAHAPEVQEVPEAETTADTTTPPTEAEKVAETTAEPVQQVPAHQPIEKATEPTPTGTKRIAIVIDDMGVAKGNSKQIIGLSGPLTLSYLPYAEQLQAQMNEGKLAGHEIMIHMPMQPTGPENPGPNALYADMDAATIRTTLIGNLDRASGYASINNHMGSAFTADLARMNVVMSVLKERGLFFLDSVTTQTSAAAQAASENNVPFLRRDIFLDHVATEEFVKDALIKLEHKADRQGYAIAIGHPKPETINVLREWLKTAKSRGYEIVPLSELLKN